jgi:hypothetical protein
LQNEINYIPLSLPSLAYAASIVVLPSLRLFAWPFEIFDTPREMSRFEDCYLHLWMWISAHQERLESHE